MAYTYVIKHNGVPIWVGVGTGLRYLAHTHSLPHETPIAKRDYILLYHAEITSEIVLANVSREEAWQKERNLIAEYGFRGEGGTLFNRTYGGKSETPSPTSRADAKTRRKAKMETIQPSIDNDEINAIIDFHLKRILGGSHFATPKQTCALLGISMATFNRRVRNKTIATVPRGGYRGVARPVLQNLLKYGLKTNS
jgi:hypothetical protein